MTVASNAMNADARLSQPLRARKWRRDPHDYYVEQHWCSSRLFETEVFDGSIYDPACGSGRIVLSACRAGYRAYGTDKIRRSPICRETLDFCETSPPARQKAHNIVCNPPFKIAELIVDLALEHCLRKVAMLLSHDWLAGDERTHWLESKPMRRVLILTPRPSMPPGRSSNAASNRPAARKTSPGIFSRSATRDRVNSDGYGAMAKASR